MVKIQEAENQIITSYEVYESKPSDSDLLVKAVEQHCKRLGQIPDLVAADAAFHSPSQKEAIEQMGVTHISVPNRPTKNPAIRKIQKTRWFRKGQKWRTGCEGRISVLKILLSIESRAAVLRQKHVGAFGKVLRLTAIASCAWLTLTSRS